MNQPDNQFENNVPIYGAPLQPPPAPPVVEEPARLNWMQRWFGVLMSPGETFADVNRKPTILVPIIILVVITAASAFLIQRKLEPPAPIDEDLYELQDERKQQIKTVPGSLAEAVTALEQDHDFLLAGDVFTPDVLETWISLKRTKDIAAVTLRPHPYEFFLYYDA